MNSRRLAIIGVIVLAVVTAGLIGLTTTVPGWDAVQSGSGVYKTVTGGKP